MQIKQSNSIDLSNHNSDENPLYAKGSLLLLFKIDQMILTKFCERDFLRDNSFFVLFLPKRYLNLLILRWFNTRTEIGVDIQNWGDGLDWAVTHYRTDRVYVSEYGSGNRIKDFDKILCEAIEKANEIYNKYNFFNHHFIKPTNR